jgi:alanine racemase
MSFVTSVVMVKTVAAGMGISYGHTFVTKRETKLAVLPVGYEDGYPRCLSNQGEVLIKGKRAPILGRVCMNLCMVDITDLEGVQVGDEAVLLGSQGQEAISADDIGGKAGTISYEVLCMLGNNNQRVFIK